MAPLWRMFVNKFDPGFVFQSRKFSFVLTPISCSRFFSTGNNNNKNNVGTETSTSGLWHINRYWKQAKTTTELRAHFRAQLFNSQYKNLEVETRGDNEDVALIRLNRPKTMNALNDDLITELNCALIEAEADENVGAIVITGSERAFSVGADIENMSKKAYQHVLETEFANFEGFKKSRKPVIAAVNGYALGGGCELAMLCDIIYAGEKAQFAQPEIILGTIPGVGGTQRLLRAIGKSKAMEMVLTGNRLSAHEAEKAGLVSKVFPPDQLVDETVKVAEGIAERSRLIAVMCKECLNKGYDLSLAQGTHFEKRNFHATFSTHDKKEGMEAFVQKREPVFKDY